MTPAVRQLEAAALVAGMIAVLAVAWALIGPVVLDSFSTFPRPPFTR